MMIRFLVWLWQLQNLLLSTSTIIPSFMGSSPAIALDVAAPRFVQSKVSSIQSSKVICKMQGASFVPILMVQSAAGIGPPPVALDPDLEPNRSDLFHRLVVERSTREGSSLMGPKAAKNLDEKFQGVRVNVGASVTYVGDAKGGHEVIFEEGEKQEIHQVHGGGQVLGEVEAALEASNSDCGVATTNK